MTKHEADLIAMLLGDAAPSRTLTEWLGTDAGRRALAAYRLTLRELERAYGDVDLGAPSAAAFYAALRTPIGRVLVAATANGLVRISFRRSEESFAAELRASMPGTVVRSPDRTAPILEQLRAYFAGTLKTFDLALDLRLMTPFQRRVLLATRDVPAGELVSYGEVARRIGQPGASRAVGQALGHNPIPIVIPCHRIIASGGRLGGYTGGLAIKKKLLAIEGTPAP